MRTLITLCLASWLVGSAFAAGSFEMPATAKTTEQITKMAEAIVGPRLVQSAEFNRMGRRIFALWYCPFSGRAACYLRVYYFDWEKAEWRRFVDELVEGTQDLSAEIPFPIRHPAINPPGAPATPRGLESSEELIVFRSVRGEIVFKASITELPRRPIPWP
jgi:hypothetical protein